MSNEECRLANSEVWRGTWRDDWRVMGQEGYLIEKHLQHRRFHRELCHEDFDQCDFCWTSFENNDNTPVRAYFAPQEHVWICENCYRDFYSHFRWTVEEIDDQIVSDVRPWNLRIPWLPRLIYLANFAFMAYRKTSNQDSTISRAVTITRRWVDSLMRMHWYQQGKACQAITCLRTV